MKITVNSQPRCVAEGMTLSELILQLELDVTQIAVEYNRRIVEREQFDAVVLKSTDKIEIVNFVAGG